MAQYIIKQKVYTTEIPDGNLIEDGETAVKLGVQGYPGLKFKLNSDVNISPVIIGETGIFELDLTNTDTGFINYFSFVENQSTLLPNKIIVDMLVIKNASMEGEQ